MWSPVPAPPLLSSAVLGAGFWEMGVSVVPFPARIRALGVPSSWLGYVGVADVEGTAERMVGR